MFDFETYWDDSGTHDSSPIAVAACFVAEREQWEWFVRDWDQARNDEGFDYFHMADFMALPKYQKEPYCNWDQAKKNRVFSRLATIINTRVRMGFAFAVPVAAFERFAPSYVKEEMTSDAFIFAAQSVLSLVSDWWAQYAKGGSVQYIFEDRKSMGKIHQIWHTSKEYPEQAAQLGINVEAPDGFSFQSPKIFKPLQAADMLAWNQYVHMRDVILKGLSDRDNCRPYFHQLRVDRPMRLGFMTDAQVEQAFTALKQKEDEIGKRPYLLPRYVRKMFNVSSTHELRIARPIHMNPFRTYTGG
jgi:hypothetical protein